MRKILAIDAGGTSSRAVLLDESGACSGFGRASGGNPTAVGVAGAVDALALAAERALGGQTPSPTSDSLVVIALAGTATPPFITLLESRLAGLGLAGRTVIEPDLLGTFCSGTPLAEGYAVIAGTGTIAARISDGQIHTVKGGSGWLLGDAGSGFWIGQQVARAVVASLDGLGPATTLTQLLLEATGIERTGARSRGRSEELSRLVHELHALRPVELARFAPLAFQALDVSPADPVAREILEAAAEAIARVLSAAREPEFGDTSVPGVVVLGGSVLAAGLARAPAIFTDALQDALGGAELVPVEDGIVGAAVLAFRHLGLEVDPALHRRLTAEIDGARASAGVA
ncbi:BadF/BadG/BcrA/BcrD ATPase family protein [soil metagenome]